MLAGSPRRIDHVTNDVAVAMTHDGCDLCLEENNEHKVCKCGNHRTSSVPNLDHADDQANGSFAHAVINMIGMLIVSTPYALETGGWASIFLLISLAVICTYTSHILGKCLENSPKSQSYTDIGHLAFGSKGKLLASTFIYLEIFMALVSYTISLHDNIATVFSSFHWAVGMISTSQLLTLAAILVALPSLWIRNLSSISFLSSVGILMSFVIFGCVVLTAAVGGVTADKNIPVIRVRNIPAISGLYVFSYGGHIVFPNLYRSMKDPTKFTKVSIVSFTAVTSLYTSLAFLGAKMFGPGVSSQITLSLPPDHIFTKVALWATVITPMTKYALEFAPIAIQLEQTLPSWMKPRTRSLVSVGICVVLPCVFYLKISWREAGKFVLVLNWGLIGVGCVLGVTGTVSSSKLLISSLRRGHNDHLGSS
ncbi:Amino acid transporter AVT1H [Linum perenne]